MTQSTITITDANGTPRQFQVTITAGGAYLANDIITDPTGANLAQVDAFGNQAFQSGGSKTVFNLTAAAVIKASPGRLRRISIIAAGTSSGAFTLNDCATTGAAAIGNEICNITYTGAAALVAAGQPFITCDWNCLVGIVLSAVPGSGSPICAVSYD